MFSICLGFNTVLYIVFVCNPAHWNQTNFFFSLEFQKLATQNSLKFSTFTCPIDVSGFQSPMIFSSGTLWRHRPIFIYQIRIRILNELFHQEIEWRYFANFSMVMSSINWYHTSGLSKNILSWNDQNLFCYQKKNSMKYSKIDPDLLDDFNGFVRHQLSVSETLSRSDLEWTHVTSSDHECQSVTMNQFTSVRTYIPLPVPLMPRNK